MQSLISFDYYLFHLINGLPHNVFLDIFFGFFSIIGASFIIWILLALIYLMYEENRHPRAIISLLLAGILDLWIVEIIMKNLFGRLRPGFNLPDTIVLFGNNYTFSFPSGHAALSFAGAYILSYFHPRYKFYSYFLAFLVSFSRIYLGKHYPFDVAVGMLVGTIIGYFSIKIISSIPTFNLKTAHKKNKKHH